MAHLTKLHYACTYMYVLGRGKVWCAGENKHSSVGFYNGSKAWFNGT